MASSFDGKTIVITGAGRGIGREHARFLAAEGANLVVNDLGGGMNGDGQDAGPAESLAEELRATGAAVVANADDVADSSGAQSLIDLAISTFGDLHGLVNNAGILRDRTLVNMSDDDWDLAVRVNLRGTFAPLRAASVYWRQQSKAGHEVRAAVVNTSSESGVFGNAGQANYAAAKAGVAALTEVASKELHRIGVRCNTILPRGRTRLTENLVGAPVEGSRFDRWDPANIAPFVAYLLGDDCTFTGQVFAVGGGRVHRVAPWTLDAGWLLKNDGRWTLDGLRQAVEAAGVPANVGRDTGGVA
jgi:NAD(P)-dependent dehydrogenase (short-subunit alcohol dehydrogenase family)